MIEFKMQFKLILFSEVFSHSSQENLYCCGCSMGVSDFGNVVGKSSVDAAAENVFCGAVCSWVSLKVWFGLSLFWEKNVLG